MTIIPLSIDETVSPGFMSHIQSKRITPGSISRATLFAAVARYDPVAVVDKIIEIISGSRGFRSAEANFELILPFLPNALNNQIVRLLKVSAENGQIWDAQLCRDKYLPPLLKSHGHLLDQATREKLEKATQWKDQ